MSILERMPAATSVGRACAVRGACRDDVIASLPAALALRLQGWQDDDLPIDPRVWNRAEVAKWVSRRGGHPDRFPMNGKALCLMTLKMFAARVPHQASAAALHHDFRRRLAKALALQELIENELQRVI